MTQQMTGYPSIDKPWLKYYSEEAINAKLPEMTMYQYIWENNKDYLSDVALRYYGTKITYGKLFEQIKKAASAFYAMGVRKGDIVTIMSMHTPEAIVSIYALNYIGAVANMVYMTLAEKEILYTLNQTESKLFFVLDAALERVNKIANEITVPIVVLGVADSMPAYMKMGYKLKAKPPKHSFMTYRDFLAKGEAPAPMAENHTAPAIIVYTSGTTGEPKGVVLSNKNINAVVFDYFCIPFGTERGRTVLDILPPFVGFGIFALQLIISSGINAALWIDLNPDSIADKFTEEKPNYFLTGPILIDPIIHAFKGRMDFLLYLGGGGAPLSEEKEQEINVFLKSHGAKVNYINGYGMSEFSATVCTCTNKIHKLRSVGIPLPHVNIKAINTETGEELTYGEIGEICVASPGTMTGYYKNEKATNEIILMDNGVRWLRTGDLGRIDADGFLFLHGRLKRIYVTSGKDNDTVNKIFPQRIEEFIKSISIVEDCGVIVLPDKTRINVPVAFVQLKNKDMDHEAAIEQLKIAIEKELPDHLWPQSIHILDSMPVTPSGKIDYRALEKEAEK